MCSCQAPVGENGPRATEVLELTKVPTTVLDVKGAKPRQALVRLRDAVQDTPAARAEWRKKARIAAVMGSCPRTHASFDSGTSSFVLWSCAGVLLRSARSRSLAAIHSGCAWQ